MGLADQVAMRSRAVEARLAGCDLEDIAEALAIEARNELVAQGIPADRISVEKKLTSSTSTDTALMVPLGPTAAMERDFEAAYRKQFFLPHARPAAGGRGSFRRGHSRGETFEEKKNPSSEG